MLLHFKSEVSAWTFWALLAARMQVCAQGLQKNNLNRNRLYVVSPTCHQIRFLCCCCLWISGFLEVPPASHGFLMWFVALTSSFSLESTFSFPYLRIEIIFWHAITFFLIVKSLGLGNASCGEQFVAFLTFEGVSKLHWCYIDVSHLLGCLLFANLF